MKIIILNVNGKNNKKKNEKTKADSGKIIKNKNKNNENKINDEKISSSIEKNCDRKNLLMKSVILEDGDSIEVICNAEARPPPRIHWLVNGVSVKGMNFTITLFLKSSDASFYFYYDTLK